MSAPKAHDPSETGHALKASIWLKLSDAPDMRVQHTDKKVLRPEGLSLVYTAQGDSPWKFMDAHVSGPTVRQNGDVGTGRGVNSYSDYDLRRNSVPEWLPALIKEWMPER